MPRPGIKVKGIYGKPWSKLAGNVPLDRKTMERLGQALVDAVVVEARRDFALQGKSPTPRGQPEGLPASENFFKSFSYRIRGKRTIEIMSSWPVIEQITEGRGKYRMTWLTGEKGVNKVPIPQPNGTILIRSTPFRRGDAWIHPGFARHTFIKRGIRRGRREIAKIVREEVRMMLLNGDPTR